MPEVANCKRCNRIFQKIYSPMCPECYLAYMNTFSEVYRYVQENPELTLEEISEQCGVPLKDMKEIFYDGKLGTATANVAYSCLRCGISMKPIHRRGRFCIRCTEKIETEAGLDVKREEEKRKKSAGYGAGDVVDDDKLAPPDYKKTAAKTTRPGEDSSKRGDDRSYGFKRFS